MSQHTYFLSVVREGLTAADDGYEIADFSSNEHPFSVPGVGEKLVLSDTGGEPIDRTDPGNYKPVTFIEYVVKRRGWYYGVENHGSYHSTQEVVTLIVEEVGPLP